MSVRLNLAASLAFLAGIAGCSGKDQAATGSGPGAALSVATDYARRHYPEGAFRPDGARLSYSVEDRGPVWIVELQPQGYAGGGLHMIVRKRDMRVASAERTQ